MADVPTIVFVSFENEFAPVGGLAAVMRILPRTIAKAYKTVLITPCFRNIEETRRALGAGIIVDTGKSGRVVHNGQFHSFNLMEAKPKPGSKNCENHENNETNEDYAMFLVRSDHFFVGGDNPYLDTWRYDALFEDAYFFCKTVPAVLELFAHRFPPPYAISLHDWETAMVVQTMQLSQSHECFLTLHNPYDADLRGDLDARTVLQYAIPLMHGFATVSEEFAFELTHDVLQRECHAEKIQPQLKDMKLVGINNGNFVSLNFPENVKSRDGILEVKAHARDAFNAILHGREDVSPKWGRKIDLARDDQPIFLMFGRDDPKQKGFDVAAAAVHRLLSDIGGDIGHFIFVATPGANGLDGLAYLEDLGNEFPDNVMVFPSRMSAGFAELQKAATYLLMPSYYEPFGAANEGFANGVPVIARATGGLIQQVRPVNAARLPSHILDRVKHYHGAKLDKPTGFLYREHPSTETANNWRYLLGTDFKARRPIHEPVNKLNPIFWSMVVELGTVLGEVVRYYKEDEAGYCQMVVNGIELFKDFSWDRAADKYLHALFKIQTTARGNDGPTTNKPAHHQAKPSQKIRATRESART